MSNSSPVYTEHSNSGLWYNKFFDFWKYENHLIELDKDKKKWILSMKLIGDNNQILDFIQRQTSLITFRNGNLAKFQNTSKFVTGIGLTHPLEIGFLWHHILGTPYLPGSSLKGTIKDWAMNWLGEKEDVIERIFGFGKEKKSYSNIIKNDTIRESIGSVIFLDLIPIKPVSLSGSVLTPHYTNYYNGYGLVSPGDWESPNPIPFLTVSENNEFLLGILPRRKSNNDDKKDCFKVLKWITEALETIGIGAKTSSGYGRFKLIN